MKIFRVILLSLLLCNLSSFALYTMGATIGSLLSHTTIVICALYYLIEHKTTPNWWIIIIALFYFTFSGFQYYGEATYLINEVVKFFVFVFGGYALAKNVSKELLFFILLISSLSIAINALIFPTDLGRYSGFYLNPNVAGFMCVYGYALSFGLKNLPYKLLGQFTFTLMGLLTFSRTFIVIWLIINLISLRISIKNIRILGISFLIFSSLLIIDDLVGLNNPRFTQLKNIVNNEQVSDQELSKDSRADTWARYYDKIYESPFFGNGYGSFAGEMHVTAGVHNSYLRILGEAGIIPFILFLGYMIYLFYWSIYFFRVASFLIMQTIALFIFLLTNHNFFAFYYVTFAAMWIQFQIVKLKENKKSNDNEKTMNSLLS